MFMGSRTSVVERSQAEKKIRITKPSESVLGFHIRMHHIGNLSRLTRDKLSRFGKPKRRYSGTDQENHDRNQSRNNLNTTTNTTSNTTNSNNHNNTAAATITTTNTTTTTTTAETPTTDAASTSSKVSSIVSLTKRRQSTSTSERPQLEDCPLTVARPVSANFTTTNVTTSIATTTTTFSSITAATTACPPSVEEDRELTEVEDSRLTLELEPLLPSPNFSLVLPELQPHSQGHSRSDVNLPPAASEPESAFNPQPSSPACPISPGFTGISSLTPTTKPTTPQSPEPFITAQIPVPTSPEDPSLTFSSGPSSPQRPACVVRRQSLLPANQTVLIQTLLTEEPVNQSVPENSTLEFHQELQASPITLEAGMVNRKIWVKRRDGSPTLVAVHDDDLVDDLRENILKKYANALGKQHDAPDIQLRITPRTIPSRQRPLADSMSISTQSERYLNPDEVILQTLSDYYPGGQSASEALIIEVPQLGNQGQGQRRTPRPSPGNHSYTYTYGGHNHDSLTGPEGNDYFGAMPVPGNSHPSNISASNPSNPPMVLQQPGNSSVQVSSVPASPGTTSSRRSHRPPLRPRMNTSSPTVLSVANNQTTSGNSRSILVGPSRNTRPRVGSDASMQNQSSNQALPDQSGSAEDSPQTLSSSPPRVASPRPKMKKKEKTAQPPPAGLVDGTVPPINVLIVEDNIINLKLLEAFMKRLKVRWQSAINGKEAVQKWRSGGFHLVLMDIQLPVMSGLEATKEIRRLEKVNGIGVVTSSNHSASIEETECSEEDKLSSEIVFKSPVIIVALTASSLPSDRHEALAAGCNDFLTKPVNFVWLERKVTEWGCMQALIDFDGWKKWKNFTQNDRSLQSNTGGLIKKPRQGGKRGGQRVLGGGNSNATGSTVDLSLTANPEAGTTVGS